MREAAKSENVDDISLFLTTAIKLVVNVEHPKCFPMVPGYCVLMPMSAKTFLQKALDHCIKCSTCKYSFKDFEPENLQLELTCLKMIEEKN